MNVIHAVGHWLMNLPDGPLLLATVILVVVGSALDYYRPRWENRR